MSYTLSEYESKQLLARVGIDIPRQFLVKDAKAAVDAARSLGHPVALKLCGRNIAHKTERGLVRLGLGEDETVAAAARALLAMAVPADGECGLLVQSMASGHRELIAGLVRDRQFGPCVMLGLGGIFAEVINDVVFAAAPLQAGDARRLILSLEHCDILKQFRGENAVDISLLASILERLGNIGTDMPEVASVDINPIIIEDSRPVIVDALVELSNEARS